MKKIFTLFAALVMALSMFAVNIPAGTKLYLTPNANWKQSNARYAAYFFGNGEAWVSMTKVEGETDLYELTSPSKEFTNVIFCRMNPSATANNWNNKWNQTADLTYNGTQNWYTVKEGTWDNGGGTWALYAPEAPKSYKDITITVVANATPKIHYWDGGDKVVGSVWETKPEMVATGEENTYSYTIKEVDEATGVKYLIVVGEIQSADQQAFEDVTINFKNLLPQVVVKGVNGWDDADLMTVADDYLSASITLALAENKAYALKLTVDGNWVGGSSVNITKEKNSASFAEDTGGDGKITTDLAGDYVFTYTYATKTLVVTYPTPAEPEYEITPITMTNLSVSEMGGGMVFLSADDAQNTGLYVMLLLNGDGSLNLEESYVAIMRGWDETVLTLVEGSITKTYSEELATDVYAGLIVVENDGTLMGIDLTMYYEAPEPITVVVENATIDDDTENSGFMYMNGKWTNAEGVVYPVSVEVPGYDATATEAVYKYASVTIGSWADEKGVLAYVQGDLTATVADGVLTLTGVLSGWDGTVVNLTISATLPVVEEPEVEKPEPTYTDNALNTYAFGLESVLSEDLATLTVTYRLNNSKATSVDVVVKNGDDVVATIAGTTNLGKNTVEVATAGLPGGVELTWAVVVNGTSVEVPTLEEKIYSFYHPSGVDIDVNPENATFGMLLVNEGMQKVKDVEGYVSSGFGAGIFAFTPSFDLIPNGEVSGYNGGIEFTNGRYDAAGSTAYAPRRIRISEDGRIFVTSLNTDGNYLWEVNPDNMNEWNQIFKGASLNAQAELLTEDSAFIAAPNNGFSVKGAGENLQLAMYSVNLSGISAAAMGGFRLDEYNLGTATEWTTAPSKNWVTGLYAINYTGTQVEYDNEGGLWIASYRGTASDANPGLVHINADGVEDAKLVWNNVRQAGIRFNNDFTKLVVAGNNGAAKKATVYAVSKDANGAPVLTQEAVVDMAVVGNNLNDFAWDYAGNLYSCGNSSEKLAAWAMPYSGTVETPAAKKYAFELPKLEVVGTVKRAVQNGQEVIVLTHEENGAAHIYKVVNGAVVAELSQEGVVAVDSENAGDLLAISDIAVTEDGKLVAINKIVCQAGDAQVDEGYKRGETRVYIWNDLAGDPSIWFTSKMSSNWYRSVQGHTMAYKGTSINGTLFTTGVTATGTKFRYSVYNVIDGVYTDPAVNDSEYYHYTKGSAQETTNVGANYELNVSPLAANTWVLDGELINPFEITDPLTYNTEVTAGATLNEDLGKKYNGASYVTVGEQVLMVAPFATPAGDLVAVEILDVTNGLGAAQYVDMLYLESAVTATAAATAVEVVDGDEATSLLITLVVDATIYSLELNIEKNEIAYTEVEIANLVVTPYGAYDLLEGDDNLTGISVVLGVDADGNLVEGSEVSWYNTKLPIMSSTTITKFYSEELATDVYTGKVVVEFYGEPMGLDLTMYNGGGSNEVIDVIITDAQFTVDTYPDGIGGTYQVVDMVAQWGDGELSAMGLDLEFEGFMMISYETADDFFSWMSYSATVTTVDNVVTIAGEFECMYTGNTYNVNISGTLPTVDTSVENTTITVKTAKSIKNGQLIITKDGVEYNANGAVIK